MEGYYYLHTNGELIHKVYLDDGQVADFRESDFVRQFWPMDTRDRETAWNLLVESLSLGAKSKRVFELAEKWGCTDTDSINYAERIGCKLIMDGDKYCAMRQDFVNLQESPVGFGDNYLEAMSELCKLLGYKAQKMWGSSFKDLLK